MEELFIIGEIKGNSGGFIIVETLDKETLLLPRFSAIQRLFADVYVFHVSKDFRKLQECK
jgi:hypothetical protein